jgi:hypothetical protein
MIATLRPERALSLLVRDSSPIRGVWAGPGRTPLRVPLTRSQEGHSCL